MKRKIITINEETCTGCGLCMPNCPEGAIQIIDGKARLVSDFMCDGLGACLGHCPENAITIEEKEAEPYNESSVMVNIVKQGENTITAHLKHLKEHGETEYLNEAMHYLQENNISVPQSYLIQEEKTMSAQGCPGLRVKTIERKSNQVDPSTEQPSELTHWPVQLHLISPSSQHFKKADLLIAADCTAFTVGNFHANYLKDKKLVIACPKLDEGLEIYRDKITALIDEAEVNTITVMIMQVPCCGGLFSIVEQAAKNATRKVPVKAVIISIEGEMLKEEWI